MCNGYVPKYLKDLIVKLPVRRNLWSNGDVSRLPVPYTKNKTFASRSFNVAGPETWNNFPRIIREGKNIDSFKPKLKTSLFKEYLDCWMYYQF